MPWLMAKQKPFQCPVCQAANTCPDDTRLGYCTTCRRVTKTDLRAVDSKICAVGSCAIVLESDGLCFCTLHFEQISNRVRREIYRALANYKRRRENSEAELADVVAAAVKEINKGMECGR